MSLVGHWWREKKGNIFRIAALTIPVYIFCCLKIFIVGNVEKIYFRKLFEVYFSLHTPEGEITCRVWNRESFLEFVLFFLFL